MIVKYGWRLLSPTAAVVVTTATFGKSFVPFYLVGSTPIFAAACFFGVLLVLLGGRNLAEQASYVSEIFIVFALFYCAVIASFLFGSLHRVPATHLVGLLIFNGLFFVFGFAAARALKAAFIVLLVQATIYILVIAQYSVRVGDPMRHGYLDDIFGAGAPAITFHQPIGTALGLAALATIAFTAGRTRLLALAALPLVFLFMFHIAARTAMIALACSVLFFGGAALWARSRKLTIIGVTTVIAIATAASFLFYQRALDDKTVDATTPNAVSRTIREIQDPNPQFRMQIWARAINRIASEPDKILLGRGIGVFPVDEGFGPPNWLLTPAEGTRHYPHNIYIEALYEGGVAGLLPLLALTLLPLFISLQRWNSYDAADRTAVLLYVFSLTAVQSSGALALSYDFQFFLGIAIGVIALSRQREQAGSAAQFATSSARPFSRPS